MEPKVLVKLVSKKEPSRWPLKKQKERRKEPESADMKMRPVEEAARTARSGQAMAGCGVGLLQCARSWEARPPHQWTACSRQAKSGSARRGRIVLLHMYTDTVKQRRWACHWADRAAWAALGLDSMQQSTWLTAVEDCCCCTTQAASDRDLGAGRCSGQV